MMGPAYFVIAILGCADGGTSCTPVTTLQTHYSSAQECSAATPAALVANDELDFPTIVARCRPGRALKTAQELRDKTLPARVGRT